jgi:hypothetical protein
MKLPTGPVRVLQPGTAAADGRRDGVDGLILAHHAAVQLVFHADQLVALAFQQLGHRDARPLGDHGCDLFAGHLLFEQCLLALEIAHPFLGLGQLAFQLLQRAVASSAARSSE